MNLPQVLPKPRAALAFTVICLFFSCCCIPASLGSVIVTRNINPDPPAGIPEVAFDNLDLLPESVTGFAGDTRDILAQQFFLGDNTGLRRVELALHQVGNPPGEITVELWDDDGSGQPHSKIAEIGSVNNRIPFAPSTLSFDADIRGLTSNRPYYIALSFLNASAEFETNSVGWELVRDGESGAAPGLILVDFLEGQRVTRDWRPVGAGAIGTSFEGLVDYFAMRVVAVPEPGSLLLLLTVAITIASKSRLPRPVRPFRGTHSQSQLATGPIP